MLHTDDVFPPPSRRPDSAGSSWTPPGSSTCCHPIWATDVAITTLGGIAPVPMAEFTVMSVLALAHHQPLWTPCDASAWPTPATGQDLTPLPVDGATATIVGYGRVGQEVARLLQRWAAGGRCDPSRAGPREQPAQYDTGRQGADDPPSTSVAELPEVLARTDYLVVATPRTAETEGMIGAAELALLPPGACLVNVSRGGVVEERPCSRPRTGQLRYVATDVFDEEPLPPDSLWWEHPRTLITPHVAGLAPRYREQVLELVRPMSGATATAVP